MWKVQIWEYERGWGSRLDEVKTFVTHPDAVIFQKKFNEVNIEVFVPEYYRVAKEPYYAEE